jgi:twitching motility two-component system response regulator PilH
MEAGSVGHLFSKEIAVVDAAPSIVMILGVDSDFTYLMQYYAKKSGRQVVVSPPDAESLALAKQEKPALIVLEADQPNALSREVLQTIKMDRATWDIPVVVCSWLDREANGLAESATYYLQKPVLYEDFVTALAEIGQGGGLEGDGST